MSRRYIFLIAAVCLPAMGVAQDNKNRIVVDSILSDSKLNRPDDGVFDTYPMPNLYRRDYAVAMPNAYRGDNCVPMPNLYQEKPTRFISKADRTGSSTPDSLLLRELDKLKDTLLKKQRLKADRP